MAAGLIRQLQPSLQGVAPPGAPDPAAVAAAAAQAAQVAAAAAGAQAGAVPRQQNVYEGHFPAPRGAHRFTVPGRLGYNRYQYMAGGPAQQHQQQPQLQPQPQQQQYHIQQQMYGPGDQGGFIQMGATGFPNMAQVMGSLFGGVLWGQQQEGTRQPTRFAATPLPQQPAEVENVSWHVTNCWPELPADRIPGIFGFAQ
jgi:hypothetical protein